jgi:CheY-like chemotaxis protein
MLESVGTLAGAVTLDLNNLLGAILGHASFMKKRMDPRSPYFEDVAAIESATLSAARMVDQLCSFVQPAGDARTLIDLNAAVKNLAAVLKGAFGERITIALELTSGLPPIIADDVLIDRTLIALLVNAYKALPQGGTISVRTGSISRDKAVALGLQDAEGGGVSLSVRDTGIGIPGDLKDRLFEPFLSAGMDRTSAGLGLTVVKETVDRLNGTIHVESQVGRGSEFTLYFPAAAGSVAEPDDMDDTLPRGKERIFVVDNEPMICTMARRLLEAGGYEVATFQDGVEALELYRNHSSEINLVILDLALEPRSGREIAAEIFTLNPEARVIVTSGFSTFDGTDLTGIDRVAGFIRKPYLMKQLLQMVRDVLDGKEVTPA